MDAGDGLALLAHALDREEEDKLFYRWVQSGAHTAMPFDQFKQSLVRVPAKKEEEILEDVGNILGAFEAAR